MRLRRLRCACNGLGFARSSLLLMYFLRLCSLAQTSTGQSKLHALAECREGSHEILPCQICITLVFMILVHLMIDTVHATRGNHLGTQLVSAVAHLLVMVSGVCGSLRHQPDRLLCQEAGSHGSPNIGADFSEDDRRVHTLVVLASSFCCKTCLIGSTLLVSPSGLLVDE